jgi:hypothetical protein
MPHTWPSTHDQRDVLMRFTHFDELPNWLEALNDGASGTNTLNDARGGTYSVVTAAADNDYHLVSSKSEAYKIEAGKPIRAGVRLRLTEANVDDANIWFGFTDTLTTGGVLDNGGGPLASYDGVLFFKVDNGTVWQFETSNAGTQQTSTNVGAFTSAAWTTLEIEIDTPGPSDTTAVVKGYLNDVLVATHRLTIAGLDEMHFVCGVKAGGASAETLVLDWIGVSEVL